MQSWPAPDLPSLPGQGEIVRLHDTATGAPLPTGTAGPARLYVCGITPYDATHLGHANTYVAYDLLVRAWRDAGRTVSYAQNVTDVDDPLLERAEQTGVDWRVLAAEQTDLFRRDMTALRVLPPEHYVGVVETVDRIAEAAARMLEAGAAYRMPDGDVYADLSADPRFGETARLGREEMIRLAGENGGDPGRSGKRDPLDPLLWRAARPGEPDWDGGPLGRGRPGWHLECACFAELHLGGILDVQGGGRDLVFPHHEMSESHLRVLTGREQPVAVHNHTGLIAYEGHKMSKSRGNLVLVSQLVKAGADPAAVRLTLLSRHYREDWEYRTEQLEAATARLARWRQAVERRSGPEGAMVLRQMREALAEDLDAPRALAVVDAWAEEAIREAGPDPEAPGLVRRAVDALLGVML